MAFPEDTDFTTPSFQPAKGSSITQLGSLTLLTLILQIGIGVLVILYALPSFITTLILFPLFVEAMPVISLWGYLIVWGILPIVGLLQLRAGYRFYKRKPDTINEAKIVNIAAMLLLGIDTVISAFEGNLLAYPEVALYFAVTIVLFIFLNMETIKNELEGSVSRQSEYPFYG
jgi:hypothetical protein